MIRKINNQVYVDGIRCKIIDIIEEDGVTYYEVSPLDFNSITRTVTEEKLQ